MQAKKKLIVLLINLKRFLSICGYNNVHNQVRYYAKKQKNYKKLKIFEQSLKLVDVLFFVLYNGANKKA